MNTLATMTTAALASISLSARAAEPNLAINGDFSDNGLAPWTVNFTPNGATLFNGVMSTDIDGAACPAGASPAATFMIGGAMFNAGMQGLTIAQSVPLVEGRRYEIRAQWGVFRLVNIYNQSAGLFQLLVNGVALDADDAGPVPVGGREHGLLRAVYQATATTDFTIGVRILRATLVGEEVFQYVDNITIHAWKAGDANDDFVVDFADLNLVLGDYGSTCPGAAGDLDGDESVGFADLNEVLSNYGQ